MNRRSPIKKVLHPAFSALKWALIAALMLEVASFAVVTGANLFLYGHPREGSRVRYDPYTLYLNHAGPKATPGCPAPPVLRKPARRIWMFGGSTMRGESGEGVSPIPAHLHRMLNGPDSAVHFECWNLGENSFNSLLEVQYLQKRLIEERDRPDWIVFFDGANEAVYLSQHRNPHGHHGYRRFRSMVESYHKGPFGLLKPLNAALYSSFTKELYDKIMQTLVPLEENDPLVQEFARVCERRYDHVHRTALSLGAGFILFLQPCWWAETAAVDPRVARQERAIAKQEKHFPATRKNFLAVYGVLSRRLEGKPYFVNLQNALTDRTRPVYNSDGVHMNDDGHRRVAAEMKTILEGRFQEERGD